VEGGVFDPERHGFRNQDVAEVVGDMAQFIEELARINAKAEIVLTVSPVPLVASADPGAHALSATTYSKSVLRVAAETLRRRYPHVHYFPAYEIIVGAFNRGRYFADDLRSVTEDGVAHVMRLFLQHAARRTGTLPLPSGAATEDGFLARGQALVDLGCDELALDP
jgi:hypothetical protein